MSKHNNDAAHHDEHRPKVKLYIGVFAALMVCTLLTVVVSKFHLPRPQAIALGLAIALVKACLVGAIFMHLWGEKKLIHKILFVTAFFAAIFIIPAIDFVLLAPKMMTRVDVASQHPDEGSGGHPEGDAASAGKPPTPASADAPVPAPKPKAKVHKK